MPEFNRLSVHAYGQRSLHAARSTTCATRVYHALSENHITWRTLYRSIPSCFQWMLALLQPRFHVNCPATRWRRGPSLPQSQNTRDGTTILLGAVNGLTHRPCTLSLHSGLPGCARSQGHSNRHLPGHADVSGLCAVSASATVNAATPEAGRPQDRSHLARLTGCLASSSAGLAVMNPHLVWQVLPVPSDTAGHGPISPSCDPCVCSRVPHIIAGS